MFVLPVPAWVVGVLMIGGDVLLLLGMASHRYVAFDVHLVGAAFAIAYFRFGWNLGRFLPDLGFLRSGLARLKPRPRLKIHDPDEGLQESDEEGDRILEKVSREGLGSLTRKERRILEEYSRRMRHKYH
jgi:hypothetical protein